jgi:hypothetical protein
MKEFNGIVLKMNLRGSVLKINLYLDSFGWATPPLSMESFITQY